MVPCNPNYSVILWDRKSGKAVSSEVIERKNSAIKRVAKVHKVQRGKNE